jgi:ElaB/YqjD/DUF883 family membrane-anchored ribosome-binding protein
METYFGDIEYAQSDFAREQVLADLTALARDLDALLKATAGDLSDKTSKARSRAAAALKRVKSVCSELQARAVTSAKTAARKADSVIRAHPFQSLGVAFGLGWLIGVLVNRK